MLRPLLFLLLAAIPSITQSSSTPLLSIVTHVEIAPTKTSIYVGTVSMTMPPFTRRNAGFESTYTAKVFPYFFYNESGTLRIEFTDSQLRDLQNGTAVEFKGRAQRADGAERRIEGKATPSDATTGKLKVRVFYSKRVELIFNTTYRLSAGSRRG